MNTSRLRASAILCTLCACWTALAQQSPSPQMVAGQWEASLAGKLPLVLHLTAQPGGALTATLDSPTQQANGLPGADVKLVGNVLSFEVPIIHGTYMGKVSADGRTIAGNWSQGQPIALDWKQTKTAEQQAADLASVKPSPVDGTWNGTLASGGHSLRVIFHFRAAPGGAIHCSLDSPDQHAAGIPCQDVQLQGQKVSVEAPSVHGVYQGTLAADGSHINGQWSQGVALELDLTRE